MVSDERGRSASIIAWPLRHALTRPIWASYTAHLVTTMNAECGRMSAGRTRRDVRRSSFITHHSSLIALLALLLAVVAAPGCSKKESRYPADFVRYQRIDQAVETLRTAYTKRDESAFRRHLLPSDRMDRLETQVARDFQDYSNITLDLTIERIVIEGEQIDVFIHWQGLWKKDETEQRERGHGVLRLMGDKSIFLADTDGDVPFGIAGRRSQPAPAPAAAPALSK